jgi:hypothetical protein
MSTLLEKQIEKAAWQTKLLAMPPPTIEERELFITWMEELKTATMHIFYAITPLSVWNAVNNESLCPVLVGNHHCPDLPAGMYCVDLPDGVDAKYRNPVALAFVHFGKVPEGIRDIPVIMSVALPAPTAHEQIAAKMFLRNFIKNNQNNPEILEWAQELI